MPYDLVIVGSGAAGLAAGLYARRYQMKTLVFTGEFGGETATAGKIENYPGILSIDGYDLMKTMKGQVETIGGEVREGWVKEIKKQGQFFSLTTDTDTVQAFTVILAIGAKRRHLGLSNEKELTGRGVHYCTTCDGPLYGGKTIAMVGGGDSSVKGVNFLGEYAKKIFFIVRGKEVVAEPINMEQMKKLGDKVEVLLETEVKEIIGEQKLEKIILSKPHQGLSELALDGLFVEIGFDPDQTFTKQLGLETDSHGYLTVDNLMRTNIPGVFGGGDATNFFGRFKQDITAAALGSVAATSAYEYYKTLDIKK
ncbi:MAG: thioredoxin reductase [Parcubacteria group bacterium Greene0714_21]|nr:MAG: thioredoxin reductase [Parcubacteria group bacterium Greene0416_39]TSD04398.1 MAG: thioredoxin reductase [Parcubacteria group bacterium Greene0714_21]